MDWRDDGVPAGDQREEGRVETGREGAGVEAMTQEPADGKVGVVTLGHRRDAVEGRHQHHASERPVGGEVHGDPAAETAAHGDHAAGIDVGAPDRVVVDEERVGEQVGLARSALRLAVTPVPARSPITALAGDTGNVRQAGVPSCQST